MYFRFFSIPKAVYYYCFLPALLIIIACLIFWLFYRYKKGTHYYVFTLNYFYEIAGIILSSILLALLIGYSTATIYTIYLNNLINDYYAFIIMLAFLPLIPLCLFIWLCFKLYQNLEYKKELDAILNNLVNE